MLTDDAGNYYDGVPTPPLDEVPADIFHGHDYKNYQ